MTQKYVEAELVPRSDEPIDVGLVEPELNPEDMIALGEHDLDVWQTLLLRSMSRNIRELGKVTVAINKLVAKMESQMDKAPAGVMRPFEKTITSTTVELWKVEEDVGRPCTSATIYNDGSASVWVALNEQRDGFQEIKPNESIDFDFHGHALIRRFFFYTSSGGSAALRIPLEY